MALDPVPWMVGGGAQHSPETGRNMLHIATMRSHGIVGTSDLKVTPYPVPGTGVRVGLGSALVLLGGTPVAQQSYSVRANTATDVSVSATGSSGGRSDLVIVRVEDPTVSGAPWQTPTNPAIGPYSFIRVIPNVPPGTTTLAQAGRAGDSAEVLARIDIPANTGTITDAHIVDLRKMAQPRQETFTNVNQNTTVSTLTSDTFTAWPPYAPGNVVPEWATHAQVRVWINGIIAPGPADGEMRLELWAPNNVNIAYGPTVKYDVDVPVAQWGTQPANTTGGGAIRFPMAMGFYCPVYAYRGQLAYFVIGAHRLPNRPDRADISVDNSSTIMYDITFYEKPI